MNAIHYLKKIQLFGFSSSLLLRFRSFLSERTQIVKHLNFKCTQFHVPSGVPRGDHSSTLLFNIFTNDLLNVIVNSDIFLFADDAELIKIVKPQQDAINLQSNIDNLPIWCGTNHLSLNINKCKFMRFHQIKNPY